MNNDSLLVQTRRLLQRLDLKARKRLGQHFLIDRGVLNKIIEAANLAPDDIVLEIGPGLGVLTRELAQKAGRVIAVELDDRLAAVLKEDFAANPNVKIINADILDIEPAQLLAETLPGLKPPFKYKVVANLPYYITSHVMRHLLEAEAKPESLLVMIQKEVAEVIAAGSGERSLLSISVQFYGKPRLVGSVPPAAFYPPPEVTSAILRVDLFPEPPYNVEVKSFFSLVRAGFSAARKQIPNSLAQGLGYSKKEILPVLTEAGIEPRRRAETLSVEEWVRLWQVFCRFKGGGENVTPAGSGQD